jgi:hypothetical protein
MQMEGRKVGQMEGRKVGQTEGQRGVLRWQTYPHHVAPLVQRHSEFWMEVLRVGQKVDQMVDQMEDQTGVLPKARAEAHLASRVEE